MMKMALEALALLRCIAWDVRVIRLLVERDVALNTKNEHRREASRMLARSREHGDGNDSD